MEQPADLVIIGAFQFHNVHLMLLRDRQTVQSGDRRRGGGAYVFAYQNMTTIKAISTKTPIPIRLSARAATASASTTSTPTTSTTARRALSAVRRSGSTVPGPSPFRFPVPPDTPAWGSKWKAAVADTYTHHLSMDAHGAHQSYRQNYLDLDRN